MKMGSGKKKKRRTEEGSCALCLRAAETAVTGPLSSKGDVTAHQNCLLYSSGIYCQFSPKFDELFGFCITDVHEEVKRGSKLYCDRCKKSGATAGCEVKRCRKTFHYPCAMADGAENLEDEDNGKYVLYCRKHKQTNKDGESVSTRAPETREAGPPKSVCDPVLTTMDAGLPRLPKPKPLWCQGPLSQRDGEVAGPSSYNRMKNAPVKRRLSYNDEQEGSPSKHTRDDSDGKTEDSSSDELVDVPVDSSCPLVMDEDAKSSSEQWKCGDSHRVLLRKQTCG
ncbi:PHD finger protein 11 [Genypterus blacodes]|uniref:PHD finger protein 11 n=1 Tax=Genypterus blacodes TaxID=154954 RepID=UPI003F7703DF